jgi:hypothetical protein
VVSGAAEVAFFYGLELVSSVIESQCRDPGASFLVCRRYHARKESIAALHSVAAPGLARASPRDDRVA